MGNISHSWRHHLTLHTCYPGCCTGGPARRTRRVRGTFEPVLRATDRHVTRHDQRRRCFCHRQYNSGATDNGISGCLRHAKQGTMPGIFARVSALTRTPLLATFAIVAATLILALGFNLERLAEMTSQIVLVIWALANMALILIKLPCRRQSRGHLDDQPPDRCPNDLRGAVSTACV